MVQIGRSRRRGRLLPGARGVFDLVLVLCILILCFCWPSSPPSASQKEEPRIATEQHNPNTNGVRDSGASWSTGTGTSINTGNRKSRRKFVSYTSSKWEQEWLDHVDEWDADGKTLCRVILNDHHEYVRSFLNATCTQWWKGDASGWCKQDDFNMPMYYNSKNDTQIEWTYRIPRELKRAELSDPVPIRPTTHQEHVFSKFVFLDEHTNTHYTEYIEPLVAGLRHPLANCHPGGARNKLPPIVFRGYVIPPPPPPMRRPTRGDTTKVLYLDAGASSWGEGDGGPSIQFFVRAWERQGIAFDRIQAYEMTTSPKEFYQSVPDEFQNITVYRQCAVSSSPESETIDHPFLPHEIERIASGGTDDYVIFKLDIDSARVEAGSIQYLLEHPSIIAHEVAWEHHVDGNPIMRRIWGKNEVANMTLRQSYELFLRMRQKGIRAHSWV